MFQLKHLRIQKDMYFLRILHSIIKIFKNKNKEKEKLIKNEMCKNVIKNIYSIWKIFTLDFFSCSEHNWNFRIKEKFEKN